MPGLPVKQSPPPGQRDACSLGYQTSIDGKIGYYALAAETSITEGTWAAALASKDVALTGAKALHPR